MKTSDFDYTLPPEFIAQTPVEPRDSSRMLLMDRATGELQHAIFHDLGQFLHPNDLLVINRTRVIPARIFAYKPSGGRVEVLLLRREDLLTWECLVGGKGLVEGKTLTIENGPSAQITAVLEGSRRRLRFAEPIEPYFPTVGHVAAATLYPRSATRPGTLPDRLRPRPRFCSRPDGRSSLYFRLDR